jgi:putative transposase
MQNIHADLFMAAGAGFVSCLKKADVAISMDGRGRALDNIFVERLWRSVKYEDIYLKGYATVPELRLGLTEYFEFYNTERPHQSLGYEVPDTVYKTAVGGGAYIVDKFSGIKEKVFTELGQRHSAVC